MPDVTLSAGAERLERVAPSLPHRSPRLVSALYRRSVHAVLDAHDDWTPSYIMAGLVYA